MMLEMETERIYMRSFLEKDASYLYHLDADPLVSKYTGEPPKKNINEALQLIKNYDHYAKYNMGRLACIRKSDQTFLGWCGLKTILEENGSVVDLGYRFYRKYWNMGFATESSLRSLEYGFESLGLTEIIAHVDPENVPSIRVMQKVGMSFYKEQTFDGMFGHTYMITKHNYLTNKNILL